MLFSSSNMLYGNMTPQIFVTNICNKDIKKRRIWCRFLLYTVLKGEKIHNINTFMLINFFNGFVISIEFSVFCYQYQNVVRKINVGSYHHFLPNLKPNAYKTAQKNQKHFFSNVNKNKLYVRLHTSFFVSNEASTAERR